MENYILVTGASSGIGREIAITLSSGNRLILCGRNQDRLQETKSLCAQSEQHFIWSYDLADTFGLGEALKEFFQGKKIMVSSFVHSAGMAPISPLRILTTEQMQQIMNVNFFSAAEVLKVLSSRKINKKSLHSVVLISSIYSKLGAKGQSIYCASKGALDAFVRAMAEELAPDVRINSVLPGAVHTSMAETVFSNVGMFAKPLNTGYLLGLGSPANIAAMVEFLLSEKASWITGQSFTVDGGRIAH